MSTTPGRTSANQPTGEADTIPIGAADTAGGTDLEIDQESEQSFPASDPPTYSRDAPPNRPYSGEPPPGDDPSVHQHDPAAPRHDGR